MSQNTFSDRLLSWFDLHGRHDLPWQQNQTPYRVWVSEIMLQQTQVTTVVPYYQRFMKRYGDIMTLADSSLDEVLAHWAGLGYYARGRNLHKTAQIIAREHAGEFPDQIEAVIALPGIGRSTAGAILALSKNQRHAILDGNVKRCLCRFEGIYGYPGGRKIETALWSRAEFHTPALRVAEYTQAIMDMGATLCTRNRPDCKTCPQRKYCYAYTHDQIKSLPGPRPKKNRPGRHLFMLAMIDSNEHVAVFKRPPKGIWGGLYSLPEFNSEKNCREQLNRYGVRSSLSIHTGEDIHHAFSHFDLRITPLILNLPDATLKKLVGQPLKSRVQLNSEAMMSEGTLLKISSESAQQHIGLPAPIQKLLDAIKPPLNTP